MSSLAKILVHLHRPPLPTDGGDKRRLIGMLNYFRDRSDFLLIDGFGGNTKGRVEWTEKDAARMQPYFNNFQYYRGENNLLDFVYSRSKSFYYQKLLGQQLPIDTDYFAPPSYVRYVKKLVKNGNYDYVWLNYLEYASLVTDIKKYSSNIRIFIDIHDLGCQSRLVLNDLEYLQKLEFDYEKNLIKEANLLNKFDRVVVNSQQEIDILSSYIPEEKLVLIPHLLEEIELNNITPYSQREFNYDLLFVGTGRSPNLNAINFFLEEIFPYIVEQKPNVTLALVGSINKVIQIPDKLSQNVINLGYVKDLATVYLHARINICPLLEGAGTKVKLQEALAYALPIVTTQVGASGLKLENNLNVYITEDSQVFASKTLALLNDPQLCQQLSAAANLTFQQYYANEQIYKQLDNLLEI